MNPRRLTVALLTLTLALGTQAAAQPLQTPVDPTSQPAPETTRTSQITVYARLDGAPETRLVVVVDQLPEGADLEPGSSRLIRRPDLDATGQPRPGYIPGEGETIPDPLIQDGRAFWVVRADGESSFGVSYTLSHEGPLTLSERPGLVLGLPDARPVGVASVPGLPETAPLDPASELEAALGVGDLRQLAGDGDLVAALVAAQPLSPGTPTPEEAGAAPYGPAASIRLTPLRVTTDPADVLTLLVEALDEGGQPASDRYATLAVIPEPTTPDAAPLETGYQVRLVGGQGRVRLSTPGPDPRRDQTLGTVRAEARITNANGTVSSSSEFKLADFWVRELKPQETPVQGSQRPAFGVGAVGVQVNFVPSSDPAFSVDGSAQGFFRLPVLDGSLLTIAANQQASLKGGTVTFGGNLLPSARPFERFPLTGDASLQGDDASSADGFYLRLEKGDSALTYGRINPDFRGLLNLYNPFLQGLQAQGQTGNFSGRAFAALVPIADRTYQTQGDGTTLYLLPDAPVAANSEQVKIITFDRDAPTLKRSERVLERGTDYTIDLTSGAILLSGPLLARDGGGNPQFLAVAYASESGGVPRELRSGVQGSYTSGPFRVTGTALRFSAGAAPLFGVAAEYALGGLQLGVEGALSTGFGWAAQGSYTAGRTQLQASVQQRGAGFVDPDTVAPLGPGRTGRLDAHIQATDTLSVDGGYALDQDFTAGTGTQTASLELRNDFHVLQAGLGLAGRWTYGNGTATSDLYALGTLDAPVGPFTVSARQRVGLTAGTASDTLLRAEYALTPTISLTASDLLSYGGRLSGLRSQAFFGVSGRFANSQLIRRDTGGGPLTPDPFGNTNVSAGYELDTLGAQAGRFRVGIDTTVPINTTLSAQVAAEVDTSATTSLAAGLHYAANGTRASGRAEFSVTGGALKQVYTASLVTQVTPDFVVSPSGEFDVLHDGSTGSRFSLAAAWRGEHWNLLTNHSYRGGFYGDILEGEARASYEADERLFIRPGVAYRLTGGTFTGQLNLGATYYVTDILGVGGNAGYLFQPTTGTGQLALGAELSARAAPGLMVAGGVNFIGFQGLGTGFTTQPGFYVRLDYLFDETAFGK